MQGGYIRYDFKTATMLLEVMEALQERYGGDLNLLHSQAADARDLEARLEEFKGIGPVTVNIFLRELRGIWPKAQPLPGDLAVLAARNLGLTASPGRTPSREPVSFRTCSAPSPKVLRPSPILRPPWFAWAKTGAARRDMKIALWGRDADTARGFL